MSADASSTADNGRLQCDCCVWSSRKTRPLQRDKQKKHDVANLNYVQDPGPTCLPCLVAAGYDACSLSCIPCRMQGSFCRTHAHKGNSGVFRRLKMQVIRPRYFIHFSNCPIQPLCHPRRIWQRRYMSPPGQGVVVVVGFCAWNRNNQCPRDRQQCIRISVV
ncbi:hypothetical protein BJ165DRAFT_1471423 [Panaeolus papilionaceus]|nr:hypothetical protein BJ165DRAFT_1471423 [Panaeolus papilionaceus]